MLLDPRTKVSVVHPVGLRTEEARERFQSLGHARGERDLDLQSDGGTSVVALRTSHGRTALDHCMSLTHSGGGACAGSPLLS